MNEAVRQTNRLQYKALTGSARSAIRWAIQRCGTRGVATGRERST
jgi:hypothetical protein